MERMIMMMGRLPTVHDVSPHPMTIPTTQHVVIHLHSQLAQYHLERFLDHQGPMFLLTLLEESTHLEAQPLTRIPHSRPLTRTRVW